MKRLLAFVPLLVVFAQTTPAPPKLKPFSHKTHLKLGNIAPVIAQAIDRGTYLSPSGNIRQYLNTANPCQACHRGLEDSTRVSRTNMPQMADCLVCHNQIDPPDSCEFCHEPGPQLKPATHTPDLLDTHTRKNAIADKASCAICHGRKFTCLGCH